MADLSKEESNFTLKFWIRIPRKNARSVKGVPLSIRKEFTDRHSKFDGKLLPLSLGSIYLVKVFRFHSTSRTLDKSNSLKK